MATAKIATLAIRTLAKPIATQIKHQAQSHERFRGICISLAQFMHRTEMALRSNLLKPSGSSSSSSGSSSSSASGSSSSSGEKTKVRPLNEAKAVTNGANALAEGFLFVLAAALIMGESYRGSRRRAKQRDRTEEGLEELSMITRAIAERVGVEYKDIERRVKEMQEVQEAVRESEEGNDGEEGELQSDEMSEQAKHAAALRLRWEQMERDRERLQHAINVLLRLALKSGWIHGNEGLHLQSILDGTDQEREKPPEDSQSSTPPTSQTSSSSILDKVAQSRQATLSSQAK